MPVVGVAEILVKPTFTGAQAAISKELTGAAGPAGDSAGKSAGSSMSDALGKSLKVGALAAGGAIAGVFGTAIVAGFSRLSAIEQAQAKLVGLGHSAADVTSIMNDALASVKGTAFGLGDAATLSAQIVAAGIKPGAQLQGVLKTVADSATIAGTSLGDMGAIFSSVASNGKLMGGDLMQLQDRGIPVLQFLADHYHVTAAAASTMVSKGQVDFANFEAAMQDHLGGAALKSGNTTVGAFDNMKAAMSRFGAGMLKDVFPMIGPVFNKITAGLDSATTKMAPFVNQAVAGLHTALGAVDEFRGGWENADAKIASSGVAAFFENLGAKARDAFNSVKTDMSNLWAGLTMNATTRASFDGTLSGFVSFGAGLRSIGDAAAPILPGLLALWDALSPLQLLFRALAPVFPGIIQAFMALGTALGGTLAAILPEVAFAMNSLVAAVSGVLVEVLPSVVTLFSTLGSALSTTAPAAAGLVAALSPLVANVLDKMGPILSTLTATLLPAAVSLIMIALNAIGPLITGITKAINSIPGGADTVATALTAIAVAYGTYQAAAGLASLKTLAFAAAQKFIAGDSIVMQLVRMAQWFVGLSKAQGLAAGAQWLLNQALGDNPIGVIIMLIAGLVAGLVWFFTQTTLGKEIVANVWKFIQDSIRIVGDWFTKTLVPAFQTGIKDVGDFFNWLYLNIIKPVWDGISEAIGFVWNSIIKPVFDGISTAIKSVGDFFTWLNESVVQPVFTAIGTAIQWVWLNVIKPVFDTVSAVVKAVGDVFKWLYTDIVSPVFQLIGAAFAWWWNNLAMPIFNTVVNFIQTVLATTFNWFYNSVILPVFNAIGTAIQWVWNNVIKPVFDFWVNVFTVIVPNAINWFYNSVILPVFNAIGAAVQWVWLNVLKPTFDFWVNVFTVIIPNAINWLYLNIIQPVFNAIGNAVQWVWLNILKPTFDGWVNVFTVIIPNALNWLHNNVIQPVFTAIGNAIDWVWKNIIKPVFDTIVDVIQNRIPAAFRAGQSLIGQIWSGIQDLVMTPIRFVVNTVLNDGLIAAFNHVADFLHTQHLGTINIPGITDGGAAPQSSAPPRAFATGGVLDGYAPGQDTVHAMLSPGEAIMVPEWVRAVGAPAIHAMNAMARSGRTSGIQKMLGLSGFADGGIVGWISGIVSGMTDFLADPAKSINDMLNGLKDSVGGGQFGAMAFQAVESLVGSLVDKIKSLFAASPQSSSGGGGAVGSPGAVSGNLAQWVQSAMSDDGVSGANWLNGLETIAMKESGGNPNATNNWDSNAAMGDPSRGLTQTIGSTFEAHRNQGLPDNIFDPVANIAAAINYIKSRYGDISNVPGLVSMARGGGYQGYAEGGIVPHLFRDSGGSLPEGLSMVLNRTGSPEWVFNRQQLAALDGAVTGNGQQVHNHFDGLFGFDPDELLARQETKRRDALAMEGIYA